jgi:hypothetical protein
MFEPCDQCLARNVVSSNGHRDANYRQVRRWNGQTSSDIVGICGREPRRQSRLPATGACDAPANADVMSLRYLTCRGPSRGGTRA